MGVIVTVKLKEEGKETDAREASIREILRRWLLPSEENVDGVFRISEKRKKEIVSQLSDAKEEKIREKEMEAVKTFKWMGLAAFSGGAITAAWLGDTVLLKGVVLREFATELIATVIALLIVCGLMGVDKAVIEKERIDVELMLARKDTEDEVKKFLKRLEKEGKLAWV